MTAPKFVVLAKYGNVGIYPTGKPLETPDAAITHAQTIRTSVAQRGKSAGETPTEIIIAEVDPQQMHGARPLSGSDLTRTMASLPKAGGAGPRISLNL